MRRLNWAEYRTTEFAAIDPMRTIAILPTAAIEQHGPHLPVGVDTMIAEGMLERVRAMCPDDLARMIWTSASCLCRPWVSRTSTCTRWAR